MTFRPDAKTVIRKDGLRYTSKSLGSPYITAPSGTMSCFVCGRHLPKSQLRTFLLAGARQYRCRESEGCVPK